MTYLAEGLNFSGIGIPKPKHILKLLLMKRYRQFFEASISAGEGKLISSWRKMDQWQSVLKLDMFVAHPW